MQMSRVVAIHQPNFLPWLGFFDKLARADVFVLLDDVQFPRTGAGTPVNRVKMMVASRPRWITAPIVRSGSATRQIRQVRIDDTQRWRTRMERTLRFNYARSPGFEVVFPLVRELLATPTTSLADFNEACIRRLAQALDLQTELVRSSSFDVSARGTMRLVALVDAVGGSTYLSGDGSESYLEGETFRRHGLEVVFQQFRHPEWPQRPPRTRAGLSIVDALMRCGLERTRALVADSSRDAVVAAETAAA